MHPYRQAGLPASSFSHLAESLGRFFLYFAFVLLLNALGALSAAPVDNNYKDAERLFEQRDIASLQKALAILEKNLETVADHTDSQALIGYIYAHEANLMNQLGEKGADYASSADAFAKAVVAKQATNPVAKKTNILLHLVAGQQQEAIKLLGKDLPDSEKDADLWYFQAVTSDGEKATRSLSKALQLKGDHVWIHSDMAFRALQMRNLSVAEKWAAQLESKRPDSADSDLLNAILAAERNDRKNAQKHWTAFQKKSAGAGMFDRVQGRLRKN